MSGLLTATPMQEGYQQAIWILIQMHSLDVANRRQQICTTSIIFPVDQSDGQGMSCPIVLAYCLIGCPELAHTFDERGRTNKNLICKRWFMLQENVQ